MLDEPNSNLDAIGDEALTASMLAARARGAIVIVVAHRPSAIASVNKLLYLQNGMQVKFGPKAEVLKEITVQQQARPGGAVPQGTQPASQPAQAEGLPTQPGRKAVAGV